MKTFHLISLVMMLLLVACQQSESPKSNTESNSAPAAIEKEIQQKVVQSEQPAPLAVEASEPIAVVHEVKNSAESVVKESVVESKTVQPAVTEAAEKKEVVKQAVSALIETSGPVNVPAVVETALGNVEKGAKLTKGKCGACHYFDKARKKVGPTLMGIYNRAPAIDGVPYATWDSPALDAWLTNPKAIKPKTKMGFRGLSDKTKRDDIIAYLKTL